MRINHNIAALNTHRQLTNNSTESGKALEKLSSGLRINKAADDAAGLAISEKMRGQVRGLAQAQRNAQDGISLIQTSEGALNETSSILQRMRELGVQAGNDTNTAQDRTNIQSEMNQMVSEVNRIGDTTEFNTVKLLNGGMTQVYSSTAQVQTSQALVNSASVAITNATSLTAIAGLGVNSTDTLTVSFYKGGVYTEQTVTVSTIAGIASNAGVTAAFSILASTGSMVATASTAGISNAIEGLSITVKSSTGTVNTAASQALSSFALTTQARDLTSDNTKTMLIGANSAQTMNLDTDSMKDADLGIKGLDVSTTLRAQTATKAIDGAISKVNAERSKLGAFQNRLEHTINNLGTTGENLTAAESRVRDVDMAKEMMNFSKNNILVQASTSMLAQANQQPQGVLSLLR